MPGVRYVFCWLWPDCRISVRFQHYAGSLGISTLSSFSMLDDCKSILLCKVDVKTVRCQYFIYLFLPLDVAHSGQNHLPLSLWQVPMKFFVSKWSVNWQYFFTNPWVVFRHSKNFLSRSPFGLITHLSLLSWSSDDDSPLFCWSLRSFHGAPLLLLVFREGQFIVRSFFQIQAPISDIPVTVRPGWSYWLL